MSKPPKAPPHSDIDGVREDEKRNVDVAHALGQDAADLERARKESRGRPDHDQPVEGRDDRGG